MVVSFGVDSNAGRLERGLVQRNVSHVSLGLSVLHRSDDFRKLRPLQSPCRHPCRRILIRGKQTLF